VDFPLVVAIVAAGSQNQDQQGQQQATCQGQRSKLSRCAVFQRPELEAKPLAAQHARGTQQGLTTAAVARVAVYQNLIARQQDPQPQRVAGTDASVKVGYQHIGVQPEQHHGGMRLCLGNEKNAFALQVTGLDACYRRLATGAHLAQQRQGGRVGAQVQTRGQGFTVVGVLQGGNKIAIALFGADQAPSLELPDIQALPLLQLVALLRR